MPALAYLLVFLALPLGTLLLFGFMTIDRGRVVGGSLTLQPLLSALGDDLVWRLMWRSLRVAVVASLATLVLAYPVAFLFAEVRSGWRKLILVAVISPLLTSALVRTYAWLVILGGRRGLLNEVLLALGLVHDPVRVLGTDWAVIIGMTQIHLPLMILPLLPALADRDRRVEQTSLNLGASRTGTFFRVTVPLSFPAIFAGLGIVFAVSYTNFIVPQVLGGGGYGTLAVQVYEQTAVVLDWTRGAVLAAILLGTSFAAVFAIVASGERLAQPGGQRP